MPCVACGRDQVSRRSSLTRSWPHVHEIWSNACATSTRHFGCLRHVVGFKIGFIEIGIWDESIPNDLDFADFARLTPDPVKGRVDASALSFVQVEPIPSEKHTPGQAA